MCMLICCTYMYIIWVTNTGDDVDTNNNNSSGTSNELSGGAIGGIVTGSVIFLLVIVITPTGVIIFMKFKYKRDSDSKC